MVEFVTDMPYLKRLAGIVITRTLLVPIGRGFFVVVAPAMRMVRVCSRWAAALEVVLQTATTRFAWFCPLLERSELIQRSLYVDTFIVFKKPS